MWPEFKGRDGCRTPFPWDSNDAGLGFSSNTSTSASVKPWLPLAETHRALAVDRQEADPDSLLNHYRRLLTWRRGQPALIHGDMTLLDEHAQVFAFVRSHGDERLLCAFNMSDTAAALDLPSSLKVADSLPDSGASGAVASRGGHIDFQPWGVCFARLG
jgi:alpha-glucosidase